MNTTDVARKVLEAQVIGVCPECDGLGIVYADVPVSDPRHGKAFPCPAPDCEEGKKRRALRVKRIFTETKLPSRYLQYTLDSFLTLPDDFQAKKWLAYGCAVMFCDGRPFTQREAYEAVGYQNTGDSFSSRQWVVLTGKNGTGKTALGSGVIQELTRRGQPSLFIRLMDYLQMVKETYGEGSEMETGSVIRTAQQTDYLILDEFNLPKPSDHDLTLIEQLVRYRYNHQKPMFCTTNLSLQEFKAKFGMVIASAMSEAHWVKMDGLVLRDEAGAEVESL